jgi:hypothetical protein
LTAAPNPVGTQQPTTQTFSMSKSSGMGTTESMGATVHSLRVEMWQNCPRS